MEINILSEESFFRNSLLLAFFQQSIFSFFVEVAMNSTFDLLIFNILKYPAGIHFLFNVASNLGFISNASSIVGKNLLNFLQNF